jgi:hypothetical protein
MPDHRYVPRSFFVNDIDFGLPGSELLWKPKANWQGDATEDQARASSIQHRVAQAINERVSQDYRSRREFAATVGMDYERLGRVLRGEYVMRLEEIGLAERVFGLGIRLIAGLKSADRD